MRLKPRSEAGITMAIALTLALVMAVVVMAVAKIVDMNTRQAIYFEAMNATYRLAETGMNAAIAQLIADPNPAHLNTGSHTISDQQGRYQNRVSFRQTPTPNVYYIVTGATRTVAGRTYATTLHSYVAISNVGEYFAAISSQLTIAAGRDISDGKIYAPTLTLTNSAPPTSILCAEFVDSLTPPLDGGGNWSNGIKANIQISNSCTPNNVPRKLDVKLLFPQIFTSDLANWKTLAGPHTQKNVFVGEIYPPEYQTVGGNPIPGDTYAWGSGSTGIGLAQPVNGNNERHIYYFDGDMYIRGRVHGQVLFVSTGNIYITGDLTRANWDYVTGTGDELPGVGFASSSTAHQAILITPKTVFITSGAAIGGQPPLTAPPTADMVQSIEALIMAPHSSLAAIPYPSDAYHLRLGLNYRGTMVLAQIAGAPNNIPGVFRLNNGTTYSYDPTYKLYPPPYLPALAEIYYTLEEVVASDGMYGNY